MNKVKTHRKMWIPPFPETVDIYIKSKLYPITKDGVTLYLDGDTTSIDCKATLQYRAVDKANGVKTDWSPCKLHDCANPYKRKSIWWVWGQYCLLMRRNGSN